MFWAIFMCENTLYKYGDKIKGNKEMFGLTGYGYYPSSCIYNPFSSYMNYNSYMPNYSYNPFFNYMNCNSYMPNYSYNSFSNNTSNDFFRIQGYIDGRKARISGLVNQPLQYLSEMKADLQTIIYNYNLTSEQKTTLAQYLQTIQNIEKQLQEAVIKSQKATTVQEVDLINNQVEALSSLTSRLIAQITERLSLINQELAAQMDDDDEDTPAANDEDDDSDIQQVEESETHDQSSGVEDDSSVTDDSNDVVAIVPEGETADETSPMTRVKEVSQDVLDIVNNIYNAVNGWCTDNELLNETIDKIDKDNVLDVFDYWNSSFCSEYINSDKHGLIETIYDEYPNSHFRWMLGSQGQCHKNLRKIYDALITKAQEMSQEHTEIPQLINIYKTQIEYGLSHEFQASEDKVAKAFNGIVNILMSYEE